MQSNSDAGTQRRPVRCFLVFLGNLSRSSEEMGKRCTKVNLVLFSFSLCTVLLMSISRCARTENLQNSSNLVLEIWGGEVSWKFRILHFERCRFNGILYFLPRNITWVFFPLHKTATGDTGMIAGTEQVATEERSLPRMSDGEDNEDLYDSDAPSEESERDEDSPQDSRVDICWLTKSDRLPLSSLHWWPLPPW